MSQRMSSFSVNSVFPARLGLEAASSARLFVAHGLTMLKPGPSLTASQGFGLSRPESRGFRPSTACRPRLQGISRHGEICSKESNLRCAISLL